MGEQKAKKKRGNWEQNERNGGREGIRIFFFCCGPPGKVMTSLSFSLIS